MISKSNHIANLFIAILFLGSINLFAQRVKVPVDVQLKIIPKILSLNKNFSFDNSKKFFNTSILYSSEQRNSMQVFDEFVKTVSNKGINVKSRKANLHPFDISKMSNLKKFLKINNIKALYITPLRAVNINEITEICKEQKVLSITGVDEYKGNGTSVILGLEENKLKIMINQNSAKREGADFSSRLLKIAKLIN